MAKKKIKIELQKEINFILLELNKHQFLVEKGWDEEENWTIVLMFYLEGLKCTQTLTYFKEEDRDEQFNKITPDWAQMIIDKTKKLLK